jgi:hypothetical protein
VVGPEGQKRSRSGALAADEVPEGVVDGQVAMATRTADPKTRPRNFLRRGAGNNCPHSVTSVTKNVLDDDRSGISKRRCRSRFADASTCDSLRCVRGDRRAHA